MPKKRPFSRLAPALDASFQALGFCRLQARESVFARNQPAWRRVHGDAYLICDLQICKWDYDPWFGSSFTMNFWRVPLDFETAFNNKQTLCLRIKELTDEGDLTSITSIYNSVLKKIRIPDAQEFAKVTGRPFTAWDEKNYVKQSTPLTCEDAKGDIWPIFTDEDDVVAWCEFLKEWLPKGTTRFASLGDKTGRFLSELSRWEGT